MNTYLNKLEFNKILESLAFFAVTNLGKESCINLAPCNNKDEVCNLLKETTEASIFLSRKGVPPLVAICDMSSHFKIINNQGSLSIKQLLDIAHLLKISRELKEYVKTDAIDLSFSEIVLKYFEKLYKNPQIESKLFSIILDENTLDDRASEQLYSIRKKERNIEQDIKNKLSSFLNSKYVQEPIITIRNNRYVIPVKQEFRGDVKGLLHDTSASGSTLFIEPVSVFELNNDLNNLKVEENLEIEKILAELSKQLEPISNDLGNNIWVISKIDFAFAKAKYANSIDATEPIINSDKIINLKNARHPLIDPNKVVPINIHIGDPFTSLVITGPNTGGKTVTLKTVGLLTTMAMSGLHIPTSENSSIYVFDNIYADIGDNQSIMESLSTFSSHMTNIISILDNVTSNSLVLLDELGSGTDPVEGSSLAISILEHLSEKDILTIATTHYPEVKNFALMNEKFKNASSEFDLATLSPTYRLLIGVPGKSMAFEICKKLGLNESILDFARSRINTDTLSVEELLKNIYDDKIAIQNEKEKIEAYSKQIEETKKSIDEREAKLDEKENSIIANAKEQARSILLDAKEESNDIIKKLNKTSSVSEASKLRENLNNKIKDTKLENLSSKSIALEPNSIYEGMPVFVTSLNQEGIIVGKINKSNLVPVQIGSIKTNIPLVNLSQSKQKQEAKSSVVKTSSRINKKNISSEINVIGLNVDEAIFLIDKYLDDASICKLPTVRIVHGKGTGTLRKGIQQFLKTNKHVSTFRYGTYGEGEMGVTIVELKWKKCGISTLFCCFPSPALWNFCLS